ncbi:MAG: tRNA dihydrouridine(20/20a) synthase DusA [Trueperaceae bacterium]|nr:tRNA dihydrouridine(20/20a) synthase DusA [Trueperaceae bacterium]
MIISTSPVSLRGRKSLTFTVFNSQYHKTVTGTRVNSLAIPLSIAPMMDWTDRHYRFFVRQLTRETLLYTEMVTTGALLFGIQARHLDYSPEELPLVLQLGGDSPDALAKAAKLGETWGYSEINLNVGCPSDRVQNGNFGACLMAQPELVADCIAAMKEAVSVPVTVKHRIGIDHLDAYEDMHKFVYRVAQAGADRFSVHARKAWLKGLSPKENRSIPPLRYDDIYRLKGDFPELLIEINGGVLCLESAREHLQHVDAVMIGRAAYENPYLFAQADAFIAGSSLQPISRRQVVLNMLDYIEGQLQRGVYLSRISRHMLNLFNGQPGAKAWRRTISESSHLPGAGTELLLKALENVPDRVQHMTEELMT